MSKNKDILIGYITTLSDKECKDIYYLLIEKNTIRKDYIEFDRVRLTKSQYNKLMWFWGKDKLDCCIDILNKWLIKKNITKPISHYRSLLGWVETAYYSTHKVDDKLIKFSSNIDTIWKAKAYVKRIPPELRAYDSEIKFLVNKFGSKILS